MSQFGLDRNGTAPTTGSGSHQRRLTMRFAIVFSLMFLGLTQQHLDFPTVTVKLDKPAAVSTQDRKS